MTNSMKAWRLVSLLVRYGGAVALGWGLAIASAVVASKGLDKMQVVVDSDRDLLAEATLGPLGQVADSMAARLLRAMDTIDTSAGEVLS
jgi:hypothetical protein